MSIQPKSIRKEMLFLVIAVIVYAILRAIYLWQYQGSAFWGNLTIDARYHYLWAQSIASGDLWGNEVFFRAPFYAYFLALIYLIFSGHQLGIIIVQNLIGVASFILVYKLAKNVFDVKCAVITAFCYLLTFDFVYFESEFLLDFLLVFFLPLIFLIIFQTDRQDKKSIWIIAGILTGLAAATRPTVLFLLALFPIFNLLHRSPEFAIKKWLGHAALYIISASLVLLPIAIRNAIVGGEFTAMPTQGGINFYIGNNSYSSGWSAAMPPPLGPFWQYADCRQIAETETHRSLKPSEVSSFWFRKGLDFWRQHPAQALSLTIRKTTFLVSNCDISNNRNIPQFKSHLSISRLFIISWWLFLPFGILGICTSIRQNPKARLIFIFIVLYSISIILFFVNSRFRLPLLPFWIMFVACGLIYFMKLINNKNYLRIFYSGVVIVAGFLFSTTNFYKIDFSNPQQELYSEGNRLLASGNYAQAIIKFRQLLKTAPNYPQANMNIAASFVRLGNLDSAEVYYHRELAVNQDSALTLSSLAEISRLQGRTAQAYEYAATAFSQKPTLIEILINYAKAARPVNRQEEARERILLQEHGYRLNPYYFFYRAVLEIDLANLDNKYLNQAEGDLSQALRLFEKTTQPNYERDPAIYVLLLSDEKREGMMAKAYANLGIIKLRQMEIASARDAFQTALTYDSTLIQAWTGLLEAYLRLGENEKALNLSTRQIPNAGRNELPIYLFYQAQALNNLGQKQKAVEILQRLQSDYPDFKPAQTALEAIKMGGS